MITAQDDSVPVKPPVARKAPKTTTTHGDTLTDDYFWLREKSSPEVIKYLEDENRYTDAVMKPTEAFQEALYKEMLARIKETDLSVPVKDGEYFYYSRTEQGKQYPILCRKKGSLKSPEEITLDVNELAAGKQFMSVGSYNISDDGHLLAYSTDDTGFRQYKLFVKDLRTNQTTPAIAERVTSVAWAADNKTLFYTTEDAVTKRSDKFFRQALGQKEGELLFEEKDELYRIFAGKSRSKGYIFLTSASSTTSETRYIAADKPTGALKVLLPREQNHEYYVDHHGQYFYIRTNDKGRNFRLVTAPVSDPDKKNWKEVLPHRDAVMLEDIDCFAGHLVIYERENGLQKLKITDLASNKSHYIEFPEPVYSAFGNANPEFNTTKFRFSYQSFITPNSIFEYDVKTRQRELLKEQPVLGGYDRRQYQSERVYATASDGTKIPVSLVYKKGVKRDGSAPMLLYAYGSYGISMPVSFSSNRLSLLDRGVVYALAHIRGGGDMGKIWHEQGRLMHKKNTFTDFIACAEHLIREKYTNKDRLVIQGGSAGGLLMGAVTNMRPDLFRAVVSQVPFVDVMNTMLDASLPLTVGEYLEWGNPNEKEAYFYMKSYSPYDNIEAKNYPNILVRTSLNDSQVMYWEPAKYVAKLRAMKTDKNVLLLKTNMGAGHGGASGRYDALRETAFDYAFILSQVGITK
ncbi:MAG TPA: S9 family peptidase [Blastocatellia bacterium]|nr:S9 family peptidase [Blastocatellia bacterium]